MPLPRFIHNNSLAFAMFAIFLLSITGMSIVGWQANNETLSDHARPAISYGAYLTSGEFIEGVFENWESEFLQMWALIILTVYLRQKGSADSKPMKGKAKQDTSSRYAIIKAASWRARGRGVKHFIYSHSLGFAMFALFIGSFTLHALGGAEAYNDEARQHGTSQVSVTGFMGTSQFWYESLQNWQSEFLAIGALLVLSIVLRERGSPQSKPIGRTYDHTTG